MPFWKEVFPKRKETDPKCEKFFPFRIDPFSEGRQNRFYGVTASAMVLVSLNIKILTSYTWSKFAVYWICSKRICKLLSKDYGKPNTKRNNKNKQNNSCDLLILQVYFLEMLSVWYDITVFTLHTKTL